MIGTKFGNYRIDEKLGEGGMGVVYRATDLQLDRPVALKTLLSSAADDEERLSRFLREARAASRLQHPSIVTVYHFGVESNTRYMVMELIEGKTLKHTINGKPLYVNQMCEIGIQIADGLSMAHDRGVVHRDLKSDNVMLTPRGQAKVLDFGLAKLRETNPTSEDETACHTQMGMVIGTINSMSPEQALGREADARADMFSLGVIFYEMATGKMPFHGPTPQATLAAILNQEPTPVTQFNPEIPPELERLINQCLQKQPSLRPTATEVMARLKNIQASLSSNLIASSDVRGMVSGTSTLRAPAPSTLASGSAPGSGSVPASAVKPPSGLAPGSSLQLPAPSQTPARVAYYALKAVRVAMSVLTWTIPLAFLLMFFLSGGVLRGEMFEGTTVMRFTQNVVGPAMRMADQLLSVRLVYQGWNFLLLGLGLVGFVARQLVMMPFEWAEQRAKSRLIRARVARPVSANLVASEATGSAAPDRLAMLRGYTDAKKFLFQEKRWLALLSMEIVDASRIKVSNDKLVVEHAFTEYRKFVERALRTHGAWKVSWTADGVLAAFPAADEAVAATQDILHNLAWFNDGIHSLKQPFRLRCGLNWAEVFIAEEKQLSEINDVALDVADQLQRQVGPNTLVVTRELFSELKNTENFQASPVKGPEGRELLEWRPEQVSTKRVVNGD